MRLPNVKVYLTLDGSLGIVQQILKCPNFGTRSCRYEASVLFDTRHQFRPPNGSRQFSSINHHFKALVKRWKLAIHDFSFDVEHVSGTDYAIAGAFFAHDCIG